MPSSIMHAQFFVFFFFVLFNQTVIFVLNRQIVQRRPLKKAEQNVSIKQDFAFSALALKTVEVLLDPLNHLTRQNYSNRIMLYDSHSSLWPTEHQSSTDEEKFIAIVVDIIINSSIIFPILDTILSTLTVRPFVLNFFSHAVTMRCLLSVLSTSLPLLAQVKLA